MGRRKPEKVRVTLVMEFVVSAASPAHAEELAEARIKSQFYRNPEFCSDADLISTTAEVVKDE